MGGFSSLIPRPVAAGDPLTLSWPSKATPFRIILWRCLQRSRLFGQVPGRNKLKAGSRLLVSPFPEIKFHPVLLRGAVKLVGSRRPVGKVGETQGVFPGLSIGDRAGAVRRGSAQPTVHKFIAPPWHRVRRQCRRRHRLAEVSLIRCSPAERLMRTPQIIPVEELAKTALLFDAVGRWAQVDPFVLHGPPQALDEDVVVAASASVMLISIP